MTWLEYWSYCRITLGMSEEEYRTFPPNKVFALEAAYHRGEERADLRIAQLGSGLLNSFRVKGSKAIRADEFFPWLKKKGNE